MPVDRIGGCGLVTDQRAFAGFASSSAERLRGSGIRDGYAEVELSEVPSI